MDLHDTPAGPPPPGVTPNLETPYNQYGITVAVVAASLALTVPVVAIKLFTKIQVLKKVQHEDYVLILAETFFIAWCMLFLLDSNHNAHIWDTRASVLPRINHFGNLIVSFYCPTILFAKCATIMQLQRIFAVSPFSRIWWTSQVLLWTCTVFYTVIFFTTVFQCSPRRKIWRPDIPGSCLSLPGIMAASAITNVLLNLSILLLPIIALRRSQITSRKKALVISVFSISFLALIAGVGRLVSTVRLADTDDWTFELEAQGMWAIGEVAATVTAAAVTAMPAFVRWLHASVRGNRDVEEESGEPRARRAVVRFSDRESSTVMTETDGALPLTTQDLDGPLPPPIVPPKDAAYVEVEMPRPVMSRTRILRAPPPSPVALTRPRTVGERDGSNESSRTDGIDSIASIIERRWDEPRAEKTREEEQDGIIASIIESLRPARARPHDTAQTV